MATLLRLLGVRISPGSSSRGGAAALKGLIRLMREGHNCSFAVDGPRGPIYKVKPGVLETSRVVHCPIYYPIVSCDRAYHWHRSWDHAYIPKPFARIDVQWRGPLPALGRDEDARDPQLLAAAGGADAAGQARRPRARPAGAALKRRRSVRVMRTSRPGVVEGEHQGRGKAVSPGPKARVRQRPLSSGERRPAHLPGGHQLDRRHGQRGRRGRGLSPGQRRLVPPDRPGARAAWSAAASARCCPIRSPSERRRALSECLRTQRVGVRARRVTSARARRRSIWRPPIRRLPSRCRACAASCW